MRDVVTVEIDAPVATVARLFTDPTLSESWMQKTRYEPLTGDQGAVGSAYRLVLNDGRMTFNVTVLGRDLPDESRLLLEAPNVTVQIRASFVAVSAEKTLLTSDESFVFHGLLNKMFSLFARPAIRKAHRGQMESFKRFVEGPSGRTR